jgi:hypothetical protein
MAETREVIFLAQALVSELALLSERRFIPGVSGSVSVAGHDRRLVTSPRGKFRSTVRRYRSRDGMEGQLAKMD